tara:strand:- start:182 stop:310 length:129 start_codon:yes stop_codon:yes gene_type:complete
MNENFDFEKFSRDVIEKLGPDRQAFLLFKLLLKMDKKKVSKF